MAGISRRVRIVGHESVFVAVRITGQAFLRRAERAVVLRGLVIVVASATAASCATAGNLASNGATLAGPGVHRALGRSDAVGFPQPAGPRSRAARLGAGTGRGAYPAAFVAAVSAAGQPARYGLAVFSSADGRLLRWLVRTG